MIPRNLKAYLDALRDQGESDHRAGKPIGAFYELPLLNGGRRRPGQVGVIRHNETARGSYEIGWRCSADEARRAAKAKQ